MRVHFHIFLSTLFVIAGLCALPVFGSAHAQEQPQAQSAAPPVQDSMDKVPDEYIEEAAAFYDQCAGDYYMAQYHNCECMSVAYLDERIKQGKTGTPAGIQLNLTGQCRDAVGAAGPIYTTCLSNANRLPPGTDPEKYCECVANTYVKSMNTAKPILDSRRFVAFQTMAYTACSNPGAPVPSSMLGQ